MSSDSTTCKACNRVVWKKDVNKEGRCVNCRGADTEKPSKDPVQQEGGFSKKRFS